MSSALEVVASEPFIRIQNSNVKISISDGAAGSILLRLTNDSLSTVTNVDARDSDIHFQVTTENWIFSSNSTEEMVKTFSQQVGFLNIIRFRIDFQEAKLII